MVLLCVMGLPSITKNINFRPRVTAYKSYKVHSYINIVTSCMQESTDSGP